MEEGSKNYKNHLTQAFNKKSTLIPSRSFLRLKSVIKKPLAVNTKLSIPTIFLSKIPPSVCPSINNHKHSINSHRHTKNSSQAKLSLMIDFGLAPDHSSLSPIKSLYHRRSKKTITLSDFMGTKNSRQLYSFNDLGSFINKSSNKEKGLEKDSTKSVNSFNTPFVIESVRKSDLMFFNNSKNLHSGYNSTKSHASCIKRENQISMFNKIIKSCDLLLKDNKKVIENFNSAISGL